MLKKLRSRNFLALSQTSFSKTRVTLISHLVLFGLLMSNKSFAETLAPDSQVSAILSKYSEGIKTINDLNSNGVLSEVKILFMDGEEIKNRSGHDGGGIRQNPVTKKYEILINKDLEVNQIAHAIVHEAQHVRDELDFDQLIEKYPELNQMILEVFEGLSAIDKQEFINKNEKKIIYVLLTLFCHERRAYEINIKMDKKGLKFLNQNVINDPLGYIRDYYLTSYAFKISDETLSKTEKQCLAEAKISNFIKTIAPIQFNKTQ